MAENLDKEVIAADGQSTVPAPSKPEGGEAKQSKTGADKKKKVDPEAETVDDGETAVTKNPEVAVEEKESVDIAGLFEDLDLSEEFKSKAQLVFEAAVNEAAEEKAKKAAKEIEDDLEDSIEDIEENFQESLNESLEEIIENLDSYLDYVVQEWMEENQLALETGIKVEMAENFMEGLKELFYNHNVNIDEETIDVVSELEEEIESLKQTANEAINERNSVVKEMNDLAEQIEHFNASSVFDKMAEGLSQSQTERFRVLAEKLDYSDLETYKDDLATIKESFFKRSSGEMIKEDLDEVAGEFIEEKPTIKKSEDHTVNNYASFLNTLK